jgi:restriction system protein
VELEGFTEEQQAVPHGDGPQSQIEYRLAWARSYLKGMGLVDNSARGVWTLTEKGRDPSLDEQTALRLHAEYTARLRAQQRARRKADRDRGPADVDEPDQDVTRDWKEELLEALLAMPPAGFERLAQRLLREAGFISATVMGRSGDGGIDGLGVYRLSLVSFPVYFQCKRYRGSVGPGVVRDFRGAMAGRGDKGLVITTGSFTGDAKREATRDGAPPPRRRCFALQPQTAGAGAVPPAWGLPVARQIRFVVGGQLAGVVGLAAYRELGDVGHHPPLPPAFVGASKRTRGALLSSERISGRA